RCSASSPPLAPPWETGCLSLLVIAFLKPPADHNARWQAREIHPAAVGQLPRPVRATRLAPRRLKAFAAVVERTWYDGQRTRWQERFCHRAGWSAPACAGVR